MDNWLLIVIGVIFLAGTVAGGVRGLFRTVLSLLSAVITAVLVVYLSPYVSDALVKYTPLDNVIEEKIVEAFMPEVSGDVFAGKDLTGTPFEGLDQDTLDHIENADLDLLGISEEDLLGMIGEIPRDQQIQLIEHSQLPEFLKTLLMENNNSIVYEELGVTGFPQYVAGYITRAVMKILSFLVTFLLAIIIVRALMAAVDILGELPVVGPLNHAGGAVFGFLAALLVVWMIFLVITLLYSTDMGQTCFAMIGESRVLTVIYENNPILTKLLSF
jgi:uncharacterized membrane protein required for colicin V production